MKTAYAIQNTGEGRAILVFASHEARDAFCFRAIFEGSHTRRISGSEVRSLYGRVPSHDTCRANMADNPSYNFHVLPISAGAQEVLA